MDGCNKTLPRVTTFVVVVSLLAGLVVFGLVVDDSGAHAVLTVVCIDAQAPLAAPGLLSLDPSPLPAEPVLPTGASRAPPA